MYPRIGYPDRRHVRRGSARAPSRRDLVTAILAVYRAAPTLSLSVEQTAREAGLDVEVCRLVLAHLAATSELQETRDGGYAVRQDESVQE
jgi:hypothetical protein